MGIEIITFPNGLLQENTYVVTDSETGHKAVVDPGYFGTDVEAAIGEPESLKYILMTHSHGDHIMAIEEYKIKYPNAVVAVGENEKKLITNADLNGSSMMKKAVSIDADLYLKDCEELAFGGTTIKCIYTPGHTIGGVCYLMGNTLFSGDTLFYRSVGATHFPTGDWDALLKSIREKLFLLDDDVQVFPGHGSVTTIGDEREKNPYV